MLISADAETDAADKVLAGTLAALRETGLFGISIPKRMVGWG